MKNLSEIKKTSDFLKEIENLGYQEKTRKPGSHRIYTAPNRPTLSIPDSRELSPGVRRNLIKLIEGENYYNNKKS